MVSLRRVLDWLLPPGPGVLAAIPRATHVRAASADASQVPAAPDPDQAPIVHALLHDAELREAAIARELHDAIGSSLAGVNLLLGAAESFAREPEALALLGRAQDQIAEIMQHVRQISRGMMPAGQESGALLPALGHFAHGMDGLRSVRCTLRSRGNFADIPPAVGHHLFRIVQEAASNALRHGAAVRVRITLVRCGERCRLTVSDNGSGCDPAVLATAGAGIGIQSMEARAREIGGRLRLRTAHDKGMQVRVAWSAAQHPADAAPPPTAALGDG